MIKRFFIEQSGDGLTGYLIVAIIAALVVVGIYLVFFQNAAGGLGYGLKNGVKQTTTSLNGMNGGASSLNNLSNGINNTSSAQGLSEIAHDFNQYVK